MSNQLQGIPMPLIIDIPVELADYPRDLANGYPMLSGLIEASNELGIFRSFGGLNARNLFRMQARLCTLEKQLKKAEKDDLKSTDPVRHLSTCGWDHFSALQDLPDAQHRLQWDLWAEIEPLLKRYSESRRYAPIGPRRLNVYRHKAVRKLTMHLDTALIQMKDLASMNYPRRHDLEKFRQFMTALGKPILGDDLTAWGSNDPSWDIEAAAADLVSIREHPQDDTFSRWVGEKGSNWIHKYFNIKPSKRTGLRTLYDSPFTKFANAITTIIASVLPSLSITVLYSIKSTWKRIIILAVFNILISVCLTAFTSAKRSEMFAVSAA